jgi:methyl-accepting chemotaxis protein
MAEQVGTKEDVSREVGDVREMSEGIRVATKVQKAAVGEINELIMKINQGTQAITSGSEELSSSSEEVAGMAESLKTKVDIFKV